MSAAPTFTPGADAPYADAHELYLSDWAASSRPWLHLTATSPVYEARSRLTVTTWVHHDTAWMTVTGPLIARTAPTLNRVFSRLRTEPLRETVLNLCSLSNLDPAGVECITAELRQSAQRGHHLEIVASWNTTEAVKLPVRTTADTTSENGQMGVTHPARLHTDDSR